MKNTLWPSLFSKEQVEKTNGYSNDYWDWGMEDDDLFWRCVLEGYQDDSYMDYTTEPQNYLSFNGKVLLFDSKK